MAHRLGTWIFEDATERDATLSAQGVIDGDTCRLQDDFSEHYYDGAAWQPSAGGGAGSDTTAIHDDTAGEIAAVTLKAAPVSDDLVLIEDSADSDNKKRVTAGSIAALAVGAFQKKQVSFAESTTGTIDLGAQVLGVNKAYTGTVIVHFTTGTEPLLGAWRFTVAYSADDGLGAAPAMVQVSDEDGGLIGVPYFDTSGGQIRINADGGPGSEVTDTFIMTVLYQEMDTTAP